MVKLTIGSGGGDGEGFEPLPPMRGVTLLLQEAAFLPADGTYDDRIKWVFEIVGGPDVPDGIAGRTHWVFTNMPKSKSGAISTNSNLYEILEGVSGGEFDPGDIVDTDDYVGRNYTGDFKRVQTKKQTANGWVPAFDEDGKPIKKIKLVNLFPVAEAPPAATRGQRSYDWNDDEDE
jgi:hypothetical protein